jgi:hypothetical protein
LIIANTNRSNECIKPNSVTSVLSVASRFGCGHKAALGIVCASQNFVETGVPKHAEKTFVPLLRTGRIGDVSASGTACPAEAVPSMD